MTTSAILIIRHCDDQNASAALNILGKLCSYGLCHQFLVLEANQQGLDESTDIPCTVVGREGSRSGFLLDSIARIPHLSVLRMVSIDADPAEPQRALTVSGTVTRIRESLSQLLGNNFRICDARVGLRAFGDEIPPQDFYSTLADANLLVIPQDRKSDGGVARPVSRAQATGVTDVFAVHCAIEVAALTGLWRSMAAAPIDELRPTTGSLLPRIQFTRSQVRVLSCPGLPMDQIAPLSDDLPAPRNYFAVTDAAYSTERLSRKLYPEHLRFVASVEPSFIKDETGSKGAVLEYLRAVAETARKVPTYLIRGVQQEVDDFARAGVAAAIGDDYWLDELNTYGGANQTTVGCESEELENLSEFMSQIQGRDLLSPVSGDEWTRLVKLVLSVVDGDEVGSSLRQEVLGNENLLLLKRDALGREASDVESQFIYFNSFVAERHAENPPSVRSTDTSVGEFADSANTATEVRSALGSHDLALAASHEHSEPVNSETGSTSDEETEGSEATGGLWLDETLDVHDSQSGEERIGDGADPATSGTHNLEVNNSEVSSEIPALADQQLAGEQNRDGEVEGRVDESFGVATITSGGLLENVALQFQREASAAHQDAIRMLDRLKQLMSEVTPRDVSGVSPIFNALMIISCSLLVFVLGTCTGLRGALSFESLSGTTQDGLWLAFSSLVVVPAVSLLGFGGRDRQWQVRAAITGTVICVIVTAAIVLFSDLRRFLNLSELGLWPAVLLGLGVTGFVVAAIVRSVNSENALRRRLGRALSLLLLVYLLIGLTVWQARSDSLLGASEDELRSRILWFGVVLSVLIIAMSVTMVAIVLIREWNRVNRLVFLINWAKIELANSLDAEKRLRAAGHQWVVTAATLARLLVYPVGASKETQRDQRFRSIDQIEILKFDLAVLELSEKGEAGFLASLRKNFVGQGWMIRQYEKMVRQHQESYAIRTSSRLEDVTEIRPERDPEVVESDVLLSGGARNERVRFADSVYAGDYDEALRALPDDYEVSAIYSPLLRDADSYRINGVQAVSLLEGTSPGGPPSIADFLLEVIPTTVPKLPLGLVNRPFTANDPDQMMASEVWWPNQVFGDIPNISDTATVRLSSIETVGSVSDDIELVAVRVDVSVPFLYSDCTNLPASQSLSESSELLGGLGKTDL